MRATFAGSGPRHLSCARLRAGRNHATGGHSGEVCTMLFSFFSLFWRGGGTFTSSLLSFWGLPQNGFGYGTPNSMTPGIWETRTKTCNPSQLFDFETHPFPFFLFSLSNRQPGKAIPQKPKTNADLRKPPLANFARFSFPVVVWWLGAVPFRDENQLRSNPNPNQSLNHLSE